MGSKIPGHGWDSIMNKPREENLAEKPSASDQQPGLRRLSEILVFCTLVLLGGGLLALVVLTDVDWFFPALFYGVVVYIAWQRYF
jgi:hypothetical protein